MGKYKNFKLFVISINGIVQSNAYRDLKGCSDSLGMNYDSVKAKKRINGSREFKSGIAITECILTGSARSGNIFKFDPEYKINKKLLGAIPATEEEQKMLNWRNDLSMSDDI